eukprot:9384978-Ditylum_brightwellii.AAC.1
MPSLTPALKAVGFLPFNIPFLTDHGSLFTNFKEDILFLGALDNPLDQNQRKLVANNPTCRGKYVKILMNLFNDHKVCKKVAKLQRQVNEKSITLNEAISVYEKLNQQITEVMLSAKNHCRKGKTGHVWSLKLVTAARLV